MNNIEKGKGVESVAPNEGEDGCSEDRVESDDSEYIPNEGDVHTASDGSVCSFEGGSDFNEVGGTSDISLDNYDLNDNYVDSSEQEDVDGPVDKAT